MLTLPDEYDPCEFLQEPRAEEFRRVAEKAVDALEHKIRTATAGINLATETYRANQAMEEILDTPAKAPASETLKGYATTPHAANAGASGTRVSFPNKACERGSASCGLAPVQPDLPKSSNT